MITSSVKRKKNIKKEILECLFVFIFVFLAITLLYIHYSNQNIYYSNQVNSYVIKKGDTLWSIAEKIGGNDDPRLIIDRIRELNCLDSANIKPGDIIFIPSN